MNECSTCAELIEAQKRAAELYSQAISHLSGALGDDLKTAMSKADWCLSSVLELNREIMAHFTATHAATTK